MRTVSDIMQRNVASVRPDATLRELTRFLSDRDISGAPVVTEDGALVGVVSATDIIRKAADDSTLDLVEHSGLPDVEHSYHLPDEPDLMVLDWSRVDASTRDVMTVADIMTDVSFGVSPSTSVKELAEFLSRGRIHRAVVLDGQRLVGIVTTMDVLRAIAGGHLAVPSRQDTK